MSGLLRWKISFLAFLSLFLIGQVFAMNLGVSPPKVYFNGTINQVLCNEMTVYSDREVEILLNDFWTNKIKSKKLSDYDLPSSKFGIDLEYPMIINFDKSYKHKICLRGKNAGYYRGVIIYSVKNGSLGIGSWIFANLSTKIVNYEENVISSLTGNAVLDDEGFGMKNWILVVMELIFIFILMGFLVFFILRNRRK